VFDLRDLYLQVIVDHKKAPRNFGVLKHYNHDADGYNPLCGDRLHVYVHVNDDGIIEDISFEGEGCAISVASASLMTETLKGKPANDFPNTFEGFQKMVTSDIAEEPDDALGKLTVLAGVREFPSRIKCAVLCWHTLKSAVEDSHKVAKTE